jgi:arginyl-tRNA synthetase
MLLDVQTDLKRRIAEGAASLFGVTVGEPAIEVPRDLAFGDLATPVAFELAKRIKAETGEKRNPREIATALAEWLGDASRAVSGVGATSIAGAGYINFSLDRAAVLAALAGEGGAAAPRALGDKVLVEHTSVNPNKASHIGHMRNSVLGDSVVRILRATGHDVEIQNYIDNTGVQVADVVVGFLHVEPHTLDEVRAIPDPFDYYCWDLYSKVGLWYRDGNPDGKENPEKLALRAEAQHAIESGHGAVAEMAEYVAMRNLAALLRTNLRLGIVYDVLPRESEVMQSNFWAEAFEMLKAAGVVHYVEEGRHAGCWVMRADDAPDDAEDEEAEHAADKILVKSNGLVTYTGKDIAYHLWKLNRIDRDFEYRRFLAYPDGREVWITTPAGTGEPGHPRFGHGTRYINVIDVGQSYVQEFVKRAVMAVADDPEVAKSTHLNYEKVGLTVAACDELGLPLGEEERKKTFVGMSGRKGRGVKSDDLLDILERSALEEVQKRERGYSEDEERQIAHQIAVGAVRYFLLKFTRNSVIAFDFKEALSFTGETGPYIQNAVVRLNSIFRKLEEAGIAADAPPSAEVAAELFTREENADFWPLLYLAAQFPDVLDRVASALEPAHVAKYAFQLAQSMNEFYHAHPIKDEPDADRRALLVAIIATVRQTLTDALGALGIDAPRRM